MKQKKSLGQNFLKSKEIINKIIETANLSKNDVILEIGPGKGILTEKILEKINPKNKVGQGKVIIIEKDDRLIYFLKDKFKEEIKKEKLEIIHGDILDFNIEDLNLVKQGLPVSKAYRYKIVANIPYYITGQIIRKFLSSEKQPQKMVLMVQKEVAKRIVDEKGSLLSLSVKIYGEPKYIKTVKAKNFSPQPKVDSAILLIDNISKDFFSQKNKIKEKDFFNLIKIGFAHKRKLLISNLAKEYNKENLEKVFEKLKIKRTSRAENLTLDFWKKILEMIY